MLRNYIYEDTITLSIDKLDSFFKQKNININFNDIEKILENDYCLCKLVKCKKKKNYLCLQKLNKKNKKCKIHKNDDKYFDCESRCNTPSIDNNNNDNNLNKHNEEEKKYFGEDIENIESINNIYNKNNELLKIELTKNEVKNTNPNNHKNILTNISCFKYQVNKIFNNDIKGILEMYDYYNENKITLLDEEIGIKDITYLNLENKEHVDGLFGVMENLDGYGSVKKVKNIRTIIKPFLNYIINTNNIFEINNNIYLLEMIKNTYEILYDIVMDCPMLIKLLLIYNHDEDLLYEKIDD